MRKQVRLLLIIVIISLLVDANIAAGADTPFSGSLTNTNSFFRPKFPWEDINGPTTLLYTGGEITSTTATIFNYFTRNITVSTAGSYTISVTSANLNPAASGWGYGTNTNAVDDTGVFIYGSGGFNPASPLSNLLWANDDRANTNNPYDNLNDFKSYLPNLSLSAATYTIVLTSYDANVTGAVNLNVNGPDGVLVSTNGNSSDAYTISGSAGAADATLSYTDGSAKTATADGSGNYSLTVSSGWSGTVTPSLAGYTFTPVNRSYTNVTSNQTGQNYAATAPPFVTNLNGDSVTYNEGGSAVLLDQGGNATATEDVSWNGGKLLASFFANQDFVADLLGITNEGTGAGQIGLSGSYLTYGGVTIGTVGGGQGMLPLTVTFNASTTNAAVTALLRNLTFRTTNTSSPSTSNRTVRVTLSDSGGNVSTNNDVTVTVSAVNSAPTFTVASGVTTIATAADAEMASAVGVQPDGKILVAGNIAAIVDAASYTYGENSLLLARYNADGTMDTTFGSSGFTTFNMWNADYVYESGLGIAVLPDGKIVVGAGGASIAHDNQPGFGAVRFNANGSIDTSFGTSGKALYAVGSVADSDTGHGMAVDASGNIYMAGESQWTSGGTVQLTTLVRLTSEGALDTGFAGTGKATKQVGDGYNMGAAVAVQADGKPVVVGTAWDGPTTKISVLRYTTAGVLDNTFGTSGVAKFDVASSWDNGTAVAIQPDGKIVVGGQGTHGSSQDLVVLRLTDTGALDSGFNGVGTLIIDLGGDDNLKDLNIQSDGKILVSGQSSYKTAIVRLNSNGTLDTSFNGNGKLVVTGGEAGEATILQGDGRILSVGNHYIDADSDLTLVRYNQDGSSDRSFGQGTESTLEATPSFTQAGPAVVLDDDATVFDAELSGVSFSGATLTLVRNGGASANDLFSATGTLGALTEGGNLTVGGTTIGTVTSNSGGTLLLTFTANASQTMVNAAMRQIAYSNSIGSPSSVQINWTFSDGNSGSQGSGGAKSASGSITVTVISLNTAPVFVGATTTLTVDKDASATDIKSLLHVSDTDSSQTETWSQSVAPNHGGTLVFSGATASSGSADITSGGTVTYQPAGGFTGIETFTVQVSDGTATATREITVTVVLAPTVTTAAIADFTYGEAGSADIATSGYPAPSLTRSGVLPLGVSFRDNGDGTATISGTPNASGTFDITVTATNSVSTATRDYTVTVNAATGALSALDTSISVSPDRYLFGVVELTTCGPTIPFTVRNTGTAAVTLGTVAKGGNDAGQYSKVSDTCTDQTIAKGATCTIGMQFCPATVGSKSAQLEIPHDGVTVTAFMYNHESIQEEAARRMPPVLYTLSIPNPMTTTGGPYTITWSLLGYDEEYLSRAVFFDCSGKPAGSCGESFAANFRDSGNLAPVSTASGDWSYNGVTSKRFNYSYSFTPPAGATDIVIRFYRKTGADNAAGKGSLSLLVPGNVLPTGTSYYDADGRRLLHAIAP